MVSETVKPIISSIAFTGALAWLFGMMGIATVDAFTIGFFTISAGVLGGAIALSNTPILKGGAMLLLVVDIVLYITSLNIPAPYGQPLFVLLLVPNLFSIGLAGLELGRG